MSIVVYLFRVEQAVGGLPMRSLSRGRKGDYDVGSPVMRRARHFWRNNKIHIRCSHTSVLHPTPAHSLSLPPEMPPWLFGCSWLPIPVREHWLASEDQVKFGASFKRPIDDFEFGASPCNHIKEIFIKIICCPVLSDAIGFLEDWLVG